MNIDSPSSMSVSSDADAYLSTTPSSSRTSARVSARQKMSQVVQSPVSVVVQSAEEQMGQLKVSEAALLDSSHDQNVRSSRSATHEQTDRDNEDVNSNGSRSGSAVPSTQSTPRAYKRKADSPASAQVHQPKRGRGGGRGRGGRRAAAAQAANVVDAEDESSLFGLVRGGRTAFGAIVNEWIEDYYKDGTLGLCRLLQFFISASGCKGTLTPMMIDRFEIGHLKPHAMLMMSTVQGVPEMDYKDIIQRMTEEFDEESGDYPLIMGQPYKKFRSNVADFVTTLIEKCKQEAIYDQCMMDNIIQLLTGLADSQVRAFRHTATFIALKLMTALVDVNVDLQDQMRKNERQLEVEKNKQHAQQKRNQNDRYQMLLEHKAKIGTRTKEALAMMQYLFKSVFVHRYRSVSPMQRQPSRPRFFDVVADIRSVCIHELGVWIQRYPGAFLEDSYLKYIGWLLYDKVCEVRVKCLETLIPMYTQDGFTEQLTLFTNRFKDRVAEMAYDREPEVAVLAIKAMCAMHVGFADMYMQEERHQEMVAKVYDLVYSTNKNVATAAGQYLNVRLFPTKQPAAAAALNSSMSVMSDSSDGMEPAAKRAKLRSANEPLLRDLINFYRESQHHSHAAYLVDTLIETNEILKDWKAMTDALLEEPLPGYEALDDEQEGQLIEIMTCAVRQAATGEAPVNRAVAKKGPNAKERDDKRINHEKAIITEHFMPVVPQLFSKYMNDERKLEDLLRIPLHFSKAAYSSARNEKALDAFLQCLELVIERSADDAILASVAHLLEQLLGDQNSGETRVHTFVSKLLDTCVLRFKQLNTMYADEDALDAEDEAAYVVAWRKLCQFLKYIDMDRWGMWEVAYAVLTNENKHPRKEVLEKAVHCCFMCIAWDIQRLTDDREANKDAAIDRIKLRRTEFLTIIDRQQLLAQNNSLGQLGSDEDEHLAAIQWQPTQQLVDGLAAFVNTNVFEVTDVNDETAHQSMTDMEETNARFYCRRTLLTAFCKLIVFGVTPMNQMVVVFRNLLKGVQGVIAKLVPGCIYIHCYSHRLNLVITKSSKLAPIALTWGCLHDVCRFFGASAQRHDLLKRFLRESGSRYESLGQLSDTRWIERHDVVLLVLDALPAILSSLDHMVTHWSDDAYRSAIKERVYHEHYGDIIKFAMGKCREFDKLMCARTLVQTLQECYEDLKEGDERAVNIYSDEFVQLRELAKRFSMSFGLDPLKTREAIATIHHDGILYSLGEAGAHDLQHPPHNLSFLDVLSEFVNKLMKHDKPAILNYLQKRVPDNLEANVAKWEPLLLYRNALQQNKDDDATSVQVSSAVPANTTGTATRGRGGGRGRGRGRPRLVRTPTPNDLD